MILGPFILSKLRNEKDKGARFDVRLILHKASVAAWHHDIPTAVEHAIDIEHAPVRGRLGK
jgi:hypothetical protein